MSQLEEFKKLFWDAFHMPKLETNVYQTLWSSLEPVNDRIAGPLYSLYSQGDCSYVFEDKERFPSINDTDDFLDYLVELIKAYYAEISKVNPVNEEEKKDKQVLLFQTDVKMELAHLAYEILNKNNKP